MENVEAAKILLIDDDPSIVELLHNRLIRQGHQVLSASTGEEGMRLACSLPFDLILCDLMLPDQSGLDVLAALKAHGCEAVVVVLTGFGNLDRAMRAVELGAYDFVEKRSGTAQILHRIERALQHSRMLQELRVRRANLETLSRFAYEVNRSLRSEEVIELGVNWVARSVPDAAVALFLRDPPDLRLRLRAQVGLPRYLLRASQLAWTHPPFPDGDFLDLGSSPKGRAGRSPLLSRLRGDFSHLRLQSLRAQEDELGFLVLFLRHRPRYPQPLAELMEGMAGHLALALNNARLYEMSRHLLTSLEESERRYRSLFENSLEGICTVVNGRFTMVNRAFCRMLGYEQEELVGQPMTAVVHPEEAPSIVARYFRRLRGYAEPNRYETRLLARNGSVLQVECVVNLRQDEGKRVLQAFVRDVTERQQLLHKLDRRNRQLASLLGVARASTHSLSLRDVLTNGLRSAMRVVEADMGKIYLLSRDGRELHLAATLGEASPWWNRSPIPVGGYFSGRAVADRKAVHVLDSRSEEALRIDPTLADVPSHSFLIVPLMHAGEVIGAINLGRRRIGGFSHEEERVVRAIATFVALGISNSKAHDRALAELRRLECLRSHMHRLAQATGSQQVLRILLEGAAELSAADWGLLATLDGGSPGSYLPLLVYENGSVKNIGDVRAWQPDPDLLHHLQLGGIWYGNAAGTRRFELPVAEGLPNCAVVPILSGSVLKNVLVLANAQSDFDEARLSAVQALVHHATAELEKVELLQQLRQSEQQFRQVFDAAPDGLLLLGKGGRILEVNLRTLELLACTPTELVGKTLDQFVIADAAGQLSLWALPEAEPDEFTVQEVEIRRSDGKQIPVEVRAVRLLGLSEALWLVLLHDLSERKRYEEALRREKEFSERIIENAGVVILGGSDDGRLLVCNRKTTELTGYTREDLADGRWRQLFWPDPFESCPTTGQWEKWVPAKDGRRLCFRFTETELRDASGRPVGRIGFGQDLTDLRTMQARLVQTEKLVALGRLVAGIAHEINNPLTAILGYSQLLKASLQDPQARRDLGNIERECHRCRRIVDNLLRFAGVERAAKSPLDLNALVRSVLELVEYPMRAENVQVELRLSPDLPWVLGDEAQLQQVILNLVSNAREAFGPDQAEKKIILETKTEGEEVVLRVRDTGQGIPEAIVDRIWDPFFTTKGVGKGTGLGLSVCYGIVQEHGGKVSVVETSSAGTTVEVRLPALRWEDRPAGERNPSAPDAA
jgi:PAS domain S-box-containing protein